mmetsp:Transcript_16974/g.40228  ORF Transcript_16974/g.40228 Transcript_16974/m.40228 type:complete len:376 (+) Transcript_16974:1104-2231(+)
MRSIPPCSSHAERGDEGSGAHPRTFIALQKASGQLQQIFHSSRRLLQLLSIRLIMLDTRRPLAHGQGGKAHQQQGGKLQENHCELWVDPVRILPLVDQLQHCCHEAFDVALGHISGLSQNAEVLRSGKQVLHWWHLRLLLLHRGSCVIQQQRGRLHEARSQRSGHGTDDGPGSRAQRDQVGQRKGYVLRGLWVGLPQVGSLHGFGCSLPGSTQRPLLPTSLVGTMVQQVATQRRRPAHSSLLGLACFQQCRQARQKRAYCTIQDRLRVFRLLRTGEVLQGPTYGGLCQKDQARVLLRGEDLATEQQRREGLEILQARCLAPQGGGKPVGKLLVALIIILHEFQEHAQAPPGVCRWPHGEEGASRDLGGGIVKDVL